MTTPVSPQKNLGLDEVRHIARLAHLRLEKDEEESLLKQLNNILGFFAVLDGLKTDGVQPMSHSIDLPNAFESDQPRPSFANQTALSGAPDQEDGQFKVPAVIE